MSIAMAKEERETPDGFREVRDQRGRLLFRILPCGILEIKVREDRILVNLWEYLEKPAPK
jgi:hypothetical protein